MEKTTHHVDSLFQEAGDFLDNKKELWRLKAVDKTSDVLSSVASSMALIVIGLIIFIVINIGVALWVSEMTGKSYYGFFIVGGFYFIVFLIIYACRKTWLKAPVSNMIIKKLLK